MRAKTLLAALLVLSGCLGGTDSTPPSETRVDPGSQTGTEGREGAAGGSVPSGESLDLRLLESKVLPTQAPGVEPSVVVGPEGVIYVTAARGAGPESMGEGSHLWVSANGGASFQTIHPTDLEGGSGKPPVGAEGHLAVDAAGNAYFVDFPPFAAATVSRSTDGGASWELRSPTAFPAPVGDRPWVAAGPEGTVVVTWTHMALGLWVAVSGDGGQTFPTQTYVPGQEATTIGPWEGDWSKNGPPAVGPDGTFYVARSADYPDFSPATNGPVLFRSTDRGHSFERLPVVETEQRTNFIFPVVATDDVGTVYVAWVQQVDNNTEVFYAASTDRGETWTRPVRVSQHNGSSALPWLQATGQGRLALAYYGSPDAPGQPDSTDGRWFPYVATVDHGPNPAIRTLALTSQPVHEGVICTEGMTCPSEESRVLHDYLGVDIGPENEVHVVWQDGGRRVHWGVVEAWPDPINPGPSPTRSGPTGGSGR